MAPGRTPGAIFEIAPMAFEATIPEVGDSDNNLLFKICQHNALVCLTAGASPLLNESDNILLFKIVESLSTCGPDGSGPFSEQVPRSGDSDNALLFKWAKILGLVNPSGEVAPFLGDSDNTLLFKICRFYSLACPAADADPKLLDSDNQLLFKIAKSLAECGVCSDPAAPSNLAATPPAPETTVTWTDNATNETSYEVRYQNITQGGGFISPISYPPDSTGTVTGVIIVGASDGDQIELQVRAVSGSCVSAWVSITVIAEIGI